MRKLFLLIIWMISVLYACAQQRGGFITGKVTDENNRGIASVSVKILGDFKGTYTNDTGWFSIKVPAQKAIALLFSHTGYANQQFNFLLNDGETDQVRIVLKKQQNDLETVVITDEKKRNETGLVKINPKNVLELPSTTGGVEALIKTIVGSNNELTSQYSVRGGSYDENLVYINDFEIFRPYLVSNGQQEGLSFINPELVKNINFYTGGFQAKYGDKMSSVLDIQYKKPGKTSGSAYMSLLEQGISLSGQLKNGKAGYNVGFRNKSNRNLLSNQPTTGSYIPSASDWQSLLTLPYSDQLQFELLGIFSRSSFTFFPESVKKTTSVFSPFYTSNLGLDTYFEGQEKDSYRTGLIGGTILYQPSKKIKLKWMASWLRDVEKENYDIGGSYIFGDRDFDNNSATFGEIVNPLGAGYYQQYARNRLSISQYTLSHKGSLDKGEHFLQWGSQIEQTDILDELRQFEYQDSAGYSLPYQPGSLQLFSNFNSTAQLKIQKYSAFVQDNFHFTHKNADFNVQYGIRINYNSLSKETLISPRVQASWKPAWKKDVIWKLAAGLYSQPPFYREYRQPNGTLNTSLKPQKSYQVVAGMDYQFKAMNDRPCRLTTEVYHKEMRDVIPYDIDNVRIRYFGNNEATAYAQGIDLRLFSELTQDAESWVSLSFMRTRENLNDDHYYSYKNAAGEIIGPNTIDQTPTDSIKNDIGFLRRPSDRLITVGLFLQDYLATNKNFKAHVNMIYGSNMPYNIPNNPKYRNGLIIDPYIRIDLGFSALLLSEKKSRRSHSPFRSLENIWLSLEIFNVINKSNTISYQLIKDFANNTYAIPNKLTPRLLNLKLLTRF